MVPFHQRTMRKGSVYDGDAPRVLSCTAQSTGEAWFITRVVLDGMAYLGLWTLMMHYWERERKEAEEQE